MGNLIKILFIVGMAAVAVFAQVDTTTAKDSTIQTVTTAVPASGATVKKATTGNLPGKAPTNWSKIKDLFL